MMKLVVNGETKEFGPLTVIGLLAELGIDPQRVAVELNRSILAKTAYETTSLTDGDSIEIVHFVGGG